MVWDTGMGSPHAVPDGDYDVIVQTTNVHNWVDIFDPSFAGDVDPTVDSDEKWLKTLQTWANQDAMPDSDDEGKLVIDNTAPSISDTKP